MKTLIVDDEKPVRTAIRLIVDWERYGIDRIDEATNGLEAISIIEQEKPELVIMDMNMPLKNGIGLMEWLHEHRPETKFIVISGHNDFEFMRNTVWYSGIDYILKPVDEALVNAAVEKAVATWKEEQQERLAQLNSQAHVHEYLPVYAEKLLTSLIEDASSQNQVTRRLRDIHILPENLESLRLALLQIDRTDESLYRRFGHDWELLVFALLNICNEFLQMKQLGVAFRHRGKPNIIVLIVWRNPQTMPTLLAEINNGILGTLGRQMHFGLSPLISSITALPDAYEASDNALRSRNLLVLNSYIHSPSAAADSSMTARDTVRFDAYEARWKTALLSGQSQLIKDAVERWVTDIQKDGHLAPKNLEQWNRDIERFQTRLAYDTVGSAAGEIIASLKAKNSTEVPPDPDRNLLVMQDWQKYWEQMLLSLSEALQSIKLSGQDLLHDITAYLESNYQQNLSLFDIANRFYVSREYVSRKFKQKYGINMSEYLNRIRIDNAKLLLRNPQLKMAAIAELTGYKNEKYFSSVFKKQEGLSPNEYRKANPTEN